VALIELFEVQPDDDEAFLADWRRERNATLYRALGDDAAPTTLGHGQREHEGDAAGQQRERHAEDGDPQRPPVQPQ
jgi:hypothetical protein